VVPADTCGDVGNRNGEGNRTWGGAVRRVTAFCAHAPAHLKTLYSQLYKVNIAVDKCVRAADTCGNVGSGNSEGNRTWGELVKRATAFYGAHSRTS
jgi:hypothetical protein